MAEISSSLLSTAMLEHFLQVYFRRRGEGVPPISAAVTQAFVRYSWPGNVRELENACERIAQPCSCGAVRIGCVAATVLFHAGAEPNPVVPVSASSGPDAAPVSARSPAMTRAPVAPAPA